MNDNYTKSPQPESGNSDYPFEGPTDFHSLNERPDALPVSPVAEHKKRPHEATDFHSLQAQFQETRHRPQGMSLVDLLIQILVPLLIFIMVTAVIFFLLDVRYVYTEVQDKNLRWVSFCFILGIVALNRLIVRDGKEQSFLYLLALAGAITLYTVSMTGEYGGIGSVARGFLSDTPYVALGFNLTVVFFTWWFVNRLTHECCVDENLTAGEVGILTGTARRIQQAIERKPEEKKKRQPIFIRADRRPVFPLNEIEAVDPTEYTGPEKPAPRVTYDAPNKRLSRRHPGISIFYFTVPVMAAFALGLRVIQHGGPKMIMAGNFYVGCYTLCALMLLMLSSHGGLREYFRSRNIHIPPGIGAFWLGLGTVMVFIVAVSAATLPLPPMPGLAAIDYHQTDFWTRKSTFEPLPVVNSAMQVIYQNRVMEYIRYAVMGLLGLFLAYSAVRGIGALAAAIGRRRDRFPRWVVWLFDALDRLLQRMTHVPSLPKWHRRLRIQREIALSAKYDSTLNTAAGNAMTTAEHVTHAYDALCALARDCGVPRETGQTPFEFIKRFPRELGSLKEEALALTNLYVVAAYSPHQLDDRVHDQLRRFWITFRRTRNRLLK